MPRPTRLAAAAVALLVIGACGSADPSIGAERAEQVRQVALDAGLPDEVADVLALAARGADATFQLSYGGEDGTEIQVSQDPPNRRVDVLAGGVVVERQLLRNGVGYLCELPEEGSPGDELECTRRQGAVEPVGTFTEEALEAFAAELGDALGDLDLTVETRTIADVQATCLIAGPKAGTVIDERTPGVDTLCLAPDGAQLLVDAGGERVVALSYRSSVPDGAFDL